MIVVLTYAFCMFVVWWVAQVVLSFIDGRNSKRIVRQTAEWALKENV